MTKRFFFSYSTNGHFHFNTNILTRGSVVASAAARAFLHIGTLRFEMPFEKMSSGVLRGKIIPDGDLKRQTPFALDFTLR